jgi:hypothetical protein
MPGLDDPGLVTCLVCLEIRISLLWSHCYVKMPCRHRMSSFMVSGRRPRNLVLRELCHGS